VAAHSRSKNGVASARLCPAIHVSASKQATRACAQADNNSISFEIDGHKIRIGAPNSGPRRAKLALEIASIARSTMRSGVG
jgi:hypothetical protein